MCCGRKSFPPTIFHPGSKPKQFKSRKKKKTSGARAMQQRYPTWEHPPPSISWLSALQNPALQHPAACCSLQTVTPIISSPLTAHIPLVAACFVTTNICCGGMVLMTKHISFPSFSLNRVKLVQRRVTAASLTSCPYSLPPSLNRGFHSSGTFNPLQSENSPSHCGVLRSPCGVHLVDYIPTQQHHIAEQVSIGV